MKRSLPTRFLFTPAFPGINTWLLLHCPICGLECTHVQRVYALEADPQFANKRESASGYGEVYGIAVGGVTQGFRRDAVVIEIDCEEGHRFRLRFQQHKGATFVIADEVVS